MRGAVSKPSFPVQAHTSPAVMAPTEPEEKTTPQDDRIKRALSIPKSSLISKFSDAKSRPQIEKKTAALPVKQAPQIHRKPANYAHTTTAHTAASKTPSAAELHFSKAMNKADSHKEPARKAKRRHRVARRLGLSPKVLNAAAGTLAIVLLVGFFAYQNVPNISMRIASARAGFSAQLPDYQPGGFALGGPVQYQPGKITVSFSSNSDNRQYAITQQVSGWNSEALADNYLAANNKDYQTYNDKGRTIYLYDNANATWVSGGIWYQVDGNGVLSNEQLIKVASSL